MLEFEERLDKFTQKYGTARKTELTQLAAATKEEKELELVEPEKCVVVMTESGYIKRVPIASFRTQKRNGKGVKTQDDITSMVIRTNTIDSLMIFTTLGKMYRLLVNDIPVGNNTAKGVSIKGLVAMEAKEEPSVIYSIYRDTEAKYVFFTTKMGLVKKTNLEEYCKTKKSNGIIAINLKEGDELVSACLVKDEPIVLLTKDGMGIKFNSMEIGATSRATSGVKGITLNPDDRVVCALPVRNTADKLGIFISTGMGKKIPLSELPVQKRAGKGLICYKGAGNIAAGCLVSDEDDILVCGDSNSLCISAKEIPELTRQAVGNQLIKNSNIISVSKV